MRRAAIAALLFAPLACGLTFSPGDYREPGAAPESDAATAVTDTGAPPAHEGGVGDAGAPPPTRVALFAGRRDALAGESGQINVAETMLTTIASDGTLGPIAHDAPPPTATLWTHAALAGGTIHLHTASAVVRAPFTDHVAGPWTTATIPPPSQTGLKPWLLDEHGFLSGRATSDDEQAWTAPFTDGGVGPWVHVAAGKTTVVRGNATLVRGGDNVYIVGGSSPKELLGEPIENHSEVEVAKLGPDGEPGDFHLTAPLPPAGDASAFATNSPVAVADGAHVFVLGGNTTTAAGSLTDVACAAKIEDPATGDLDPWVLLPSLPEPLAGFAAVITPQWLVVFGGQIAGSKTTDAVIRLAIHADGTFGTSWENAGHLPAGRSSLVAVTY